MIPITSTLALDPAEIQLEFVRASGPGGQNVNKVATAVKLRFDVMHSPSLPEDVRQRLMHLSGKRLTSQGVLIIDARRYRTQARNRQDALQKLIELVVLAAHKPKTRVQTQPGLASERERIKHKKTRARRKTLRQRVHDEE